MINDPGNWEEENGKTPSKGPDDTTDVVFPSGVNLGFKGKLVARHVTFQSGTNVDIGAPVIRGNVWVKRDAKVLFLFLHSEGNDKDTFVRQDNEGRVTIANYMHFKKQPDKSTEFIGKWEMGDQIFLHSGNFIIGPGSYYGHSDRFVLNIEGSEALVLLSGATFEDCGNFYVQNDIVVKGKLLAGTPERPLKSDCFLGLSFKCLGNGDENRGSGGRKGSGGSEDVGLRVEKTGTLKIYSSNPTKARLVLRWHRNPPVSRHKDWRDKEPPDVAAMDHGIRMAFLGDVDLNGVVFNDVLKGGILLADPGMAKQWKNISLGTGNFGKTLEELIAKYDGVSLSTTPKTKK